MRWNVANGNCTEGIVIGQEGAALKKNTANNNVDVGIDAPPNTIDQGGNTATGNATDCLGVVCRRLARSTPVHTGRVPVVQGCGGGRPCLQVAVGERRPDPRELDRGVPPRPCHQPLAALLHLV